MGWKSSSEMEKMIVVSQLYIEAICARTSWSIRLTRRTPCSKRYECCPGNMISPAPWSETSQLAVA